MAKKKGRIRPDPRHRVFALEYLKDFDRVRAYMAAYPTCKSERAAAVGAHHLLDRNDVRTWCAEGRARIFDRVELSAERVLEELRRVAFSDLRGFFDEAGNLRAIHQLTAEQAAALSGVEVIIKNAAAGDGATDTVHKIKTWDKTRALEMLAKHFALLKDRVEHSGELRITHEVPE